MSTWVEEAIAFLGDQGGKTVQGQLRSAGLPKDLFDDVVQEVLADCVAMEQRGERPDNVEAFVTTLARREVINLVRGVDKRELADAEPVGPSVGGAQGVDELPEDEVMSAEQIAELGAIVDDLREQLRTRLTRHPSRAAGALAVLAIAHGDAEPADDCPAPQGGAVAGTNAYWAGLFYGGAVECFPTPATPEDPAMRQRRSREIKRVQKLLRDAADDLQDLLKAGHG